tara:strand:- start:2394 stop:3305 length:912 start_codon:yes stop_codon:yes gene_type:complete
MNKVSRKLLTPTDFSKAGGYGKGNASALQIRKSEVGVEYFFPSLGKNELNPEIFFSSFSPELSRSVQFRFTYRNNKFFPSENNPSGHGSRDEYRITRGDIGIPEFLTLLKVEPGDVLVFTGDFYGDSSVSIERGLYAPDEEDRNFESITDDDEDAGSVRRTFTKEELDRSVKSTSRGEQSYLRKYLGLTKGGSMDCGICGREFPNNLLIAAHIKPRAKCTVDEQNDFDNIGIPACLFGCDSLYEKGYISVQNGKVVVWGQITESKTRAIKKATKDLNGKEISKWNSGTAPYFNWHYQNIYKGS